MSDARLPPVAVPASWRVRKAKHLFTQRITKGCPSEVPLSASQRYGVLPQPMLEKLLSHRVMAAFKGLENFKLVEVDDFVISLRSFEGGIEHSAHRGIISPAYTVMRPGQQALPGYLRHLLKETGFIARLNAVTTGIRDGRTIRFDEFGELSLALPPLDVQRAIADFLDRKTAAIDGLIEQKQRLLGLLAEKRAALINRAVTRGLDPDVPLKDSGIPWIGEIPTHWEVRRLKTIAQVRGGATKGQRFTESEATVQVPYLRVANVQDGYLDLSEVSTIEIRVGDIERYRLRPGDVLMNEGGDNDKLGRGAVWNSEIEVCLHQNHVFAARPNTGSNPRWINLATQSAYLKHFFYRRANQSTNLASISSSNLKEAPILWPPIDEQHALLERVSSECARLRVIESDTNRECALLQEYRQSLITAAVTGQIDVG